eukprot:TRINITY_DN5610_c0_g2_i7.p1 TRINITY_DN5610_c0_g2~~TRINITY_DN5610_c0_g2_i7.p1  ORF type:complete len:115 (+),score=26.56 TRINITY_DN5610_c0_g2_i7:58-402(+)
MEVEEDQPVSPEELKRIRLANEMKGHLKFRNYHPKDEIFKDCVLPLSRNYVKAAEKKFEQLNQNNDDDTLLSLAPKKPNWDLKRDIEEQLELLERQTQLALLDLLSISVLQVCG